MLRSTASGLTLAPSESNRPHRERKGNVFSVSVCSQGLFARTGPGATILFPPPPPRFHYAAGGTPLAVTQEDFNEHFLAKLIQLNNDTWLATVLRQRHCDLCTDKRRMHRSSGGVKLAWKSVLVKVLLFKKNPSVTEMEKLHMELRQRWTLN